MTFSLDPKVLEVLFPFQDCLFSLAFFHKIYIIILIQYSFPNKENHTYTQYLLINRIWQFPLALTIAHGYAGLKNSPLPEGSVISKGSSLKLRI